MKNTTKNQDNEDIIDVEAPKYDYWKKDDINETRTTMPTKIEDKTLEEQTNLKKLSSQGSHWNNAKTW